MSVDDLKSLEARYELISELGRGGVSIVYKARDKTLDRLVAIKTLSSQSLSEKQLVQFQSEARALSGLKHKGIMEILDFGSTQNGIPYMVLEYISGVSLSKQIENLGKLPLTMCLSIFHDLCEALNHAHNKGVLHRDIKPSNIILVSQDTGYIPKIIDFGLAVLSSQDDTGLNHSAAGSPPYMSPEQIDGKETDQRSDIYSLGCTLFESLTGDVPFAGNTAFETMHLHKNAPIPSLGKISSEAEIQTGLQNCINKALAKNKNDRYQFVIAMQKAIDDILERVQEIAAQKAEIEEEQTKGTKKTSLKPFYIAAALIAIGSATYYFFSVQSVQKDKYAAEASFKRKKESEAKESSMRKDAKIFAGNQTGSIRSPLPDIDKLPLNTRQIIWGAVDLKDFDFNRLKKFERLDYLELRECDLSPKQFSQICQLKSLRTLDIAWDETVAASDFSQLAQLPRLDCLFLFSSQINKKEMLVISKLKNLVILNIQKNEGVDEEVIRNIIKLPRLRKLKIGINAGIKGKALLLLGEMPNLDELYIDMLNVDDDTAIFLASKLRKLEVLSVGHTSITLKGLRELCKLPNLKFININGCKYLQDDSSLDFIEIMGRTHPDLVISTQSEILKH